MQLHALDRLLMPSSVAVIGASDSPGKVGFTVLRNLLQGGFAGSVHPVNTKHALVQGLPAFGCVADITSAVDLAIICTPAPTVPGLVRQCGEKGIAGVLILTAGFRELGATGEQLEKQIRQEQSRVPDMRIVGPNCVGIICPWANLNASFAIGMPKPGSVAFLSQSGALCTAVLDWALSEDIGFSHFVSIGNQLDVGFADLLEYLAEDPRTTAAILYVESITDAPHFLSAARAFASRKPIVAYKAGRFAESARAASSHTGAMAGVDAVYQAAFNRVGIVRVFDMESMFQCAELLTQHPQTVGPRLAIVTNAGGPGVMATDALLAERGQLATLGESTLRALNELLPASWSHGNPVDVLGDADEQRFAKAVDIVLRDENVDTLLALLTPQAMTHPTQTATLLTQVACPPGKTIIASWMGGEQMREGKHLLRAARIPLFDTPEQAIRGLMHLVEYARAREVLGEVQPGPPAIPEPILTKRRNWFADHHLTQQTMLSQFDSKRLLAEYDIPVTAIAIADSAEIAAAAASEMGFPVVLKIHSPQITHKTEVGGVALNLQSAAEVKRTYADLVTRAKQLRPDAQLLGVTVEPMISAVHSVELILGAKRDAVFGSVIMVGYGGIAAELFQDRALELPPVTHGSALRMLRSLRCWPLLSGYRGQPPADAEQLAEIIVKFSTLIIEQPQIVEADINPLLVSAQSIMALDARFALQYLKEK
ncbi:MAG: acetate--CoA ligase family protein [Aureliella sp.]